MEKKPPLAREIARNLMGCLDALLLMPTTRLRFTQSYEGMLRSFFIPVLVFPLTALAAFLQSGIAPGTELLTLPLYSLKVWLALGAFLAIMSYVARQTGRKEHFYQFVTAYNWLSLPSALLFLPVLTMMTGTETDVRHGMALLTCLSFYCYGVTAFTAASVLRIPIELGASVVVLAVGLDHGATDLMSWVQTIAL